MNKALTSNEFKESIKKEVEELKAECKPEKKWIAVVALVPYEEREQVKFSPNTKYFDKSCDKPTQELFDDLVYTFVDHNFWSHFA